MHARFQLCSFGQRLCVDPNPNRIDSYHQKGQVFEAARSCNPAAGSVKQSARVMHGIAMCWVFVTGIKSHCPLAAACLPVVHGHIVDLFALDNVYGPFFEINAPSLVNHPELLVFSGAFTPNLALHLVRARSWDSASAAFWAYQHQQRLPPWQNVRSKETVQAPQHPQVCFHWFLFAMCFLFVVVERTKQVPLELEDSARQL